MALSPSLWISTPRSRIEFLGVISNLDIWRAAQVMVKRYGEDAAIQAALRADELFAEES